VGCGISDSIGIHGEFGSGRSISRIELLGKAFEFLSAWIWSLSRIVITGLAPEINDVTVGY